MLLAGVPAPGEDGAGVAVRGRLPILLMLFALVPSGCAKPEAVASAEAACDVATARVTAQRGLPISHVAVCEGISEGAGPPGYYVMALRAHCREEMCGSTLMGWFAVKKAPGEVFDWDVAEWKVGQAVAGGG